MSAPDESTPPKFERVDGSWQVSLTSASGEVNTYRVIEARPPRFVVEHEGERRTFFFSSSSDDARAAWVGYEGHAKLVKPLLRGRAAEAAGGAGSGELSAPMPGKVLEVLVGEGDTVKTGDRLVVVEAMKMEQPLRAPHDGVVAKLFVEAGQSVGAGDPVVVVETQ